VRHVGVSRGLALEEGFGSVVFEFLDVFVVLEVSDLDRREGPEERERCE